MAQSTMRIKDVNGLIGLFCGACDTRLYDNYSYCPHCGAKLEGVEGEENEGKDTECISV